MKHDKLIVAASLLGVWLLSWLFLIHLALQMEAMEGMAARMMGMRVLDAVSNSLTAVLSPGAAAFADATVNFALAALMWAVMMVGMMLPSAAPTILLFSAVETRHAPPARSAGRTAVFVAGYVAVWTAFSVVAAAMQTALARSGLISMQMTVTSGALGGAVLLVAGALEFTPLKDRCLVHCHSPLEWIPRHQRPGRWGAFRMGVQHGAYCVTCCWALMLLLFVGGVMNLLWVAILAAVVLLQKLLPGGIVLARFAGVVLVACGIAVLARPLL